MQVIKCAFVSLFAGNISFEVPDNTVVKLTTWDGTEIDEEVYDGGILDKNEVLLISWQGGPKR